MTHTTMTSIVNRHQGRKASRTSAAYNNYWVEVVDLDNESTAFGVEAKSREEAERIAAQMAYDGGVYDISYILIYEEV